MSLSNLHTSPITLRWFSDMGRFKIAVIALLLPSCLFIAVLLFAPALIVSPIANSVLGTYGFELTELEELRLGLESSSIGSGALTGENIQLLAREIELTYNWTGLLRGQLQSLQIEELGVTLHSNTSRPVAENTPLSVSVLLQSLDRIPVADISINSLLLETANDRITLNLAMQSNPLMVEGDVVFSGSQPLNIEFRAQRSGSSSFEASSSLYINDELALNSELEIDAAQENISIDADSTVYLAGIMNLAALVDLAPSTVILNDTLLLKSSFTLQNPFDTPSIQALTLGLDSPSSMLQLRQQSDLGENTIQVQLPVSFTGETLSLESGIKLSATDIHASGSWLNASGAFEDESLLSEIDLSCTATTTAASANSNNCNFSANWVYDLLSWRFDKVSGENLSLSGPINLKLANDELRASSPSLELSIPSIVVASSNSAARLLIEELEFVVSDGLLGGFTFSSTELAPDFSAITFGQSTLSGKINFAEDVLIAIVEIDLNQQLNAGIALQHFFFREYGDAEIQLAPHEFSSATPLSSLLDLSAINGDIVSGQIEGHANVSWSKQPDRSWEFGGPVILRAENLSGIYSDAYFLQLNTDIFAEATTPWGLRTNNSQSATIASIDIGVPLNNISWQYNFDSQATQMQIDNFSAELLGGNVLIEHMDFQADRERNEIPVVISNLDLNSIVSLADYPELVVDGLISGYLPIVLKGNKIILNEGLVGALKPGGSIRYTPTRETPSGNPSIQLVNDALSNYQFETLNTEVFYDESGDLRMEVQLRGSNPDMNDGQAINLNINITDNIPTLLRSLQASRVITEELELILQKQ